MALNLSRKLKDALKKGKIEKQLIIEIDGIDYTFGISHIKKHWRIGEDNLLIGQDGLKVGGTVKASNSLALINDKRTNSNITQQLDFEQGVSSVSSMKVSLVDENGILSKEFSPTPTFDILGREATVYWGVKDFSHPEDSVVIFEGIIDDCLFGKGYVDLKIAHPEQLKRQAVFVQAQSELSASIDNLATEITPVDSSEFLAPFDVLECFVKIDDEIIQYGKLQGGVFKECVRGALNTIPASHDADAEITSFYKLSGHPIDLTLKLLMSHGLYDDAKYAEDVKILSTNQVTPAQYVQNSLVFDRFTLQKLNVRVGDTVTVTHKNGDSFQWGPSSATITDVVYGDINEYVVIDGYIQPHEPEPLFAAFESQYNTQTEGCRLKPKYIDIEEFLRIKSLASNDMVDCEVYIKDTIDNAKEFIDKKLLLPQGLYSLPRKGKISIGKTLPPIADTETKTLNETNIKQGTSPEIRRSTNRNFYNSVRYEYHEDSLEDKLLRKNNYFDLTSLTKIKVGSRPLIIEAYSLRDNPEVKTFIDAQAKRFLDRYKFSAEVVKLETDLKTGFSIEVGDTAIVDLSAYKIGDITTRSREFIPRLMEVVNKNLDMRNNTVTLELSSTNFEIDGRYGTVSPSSYVGEGATTTLIPLKKMLPKITQVEKEKWESYIGQPLIVRKANYSSEQQTVLVGIDSGSDAIVLDPPLATAPTKGDIIEIPDYDESDYRKLALFKRLHAYINPSLSIVSGTSNTQFTLSNDDMAKLQLEAIVYIHSPDYSRSSTEVLVSELGGNTVTLKDSIEFTPQAGDIVELVGFLDGGLPYRLV